jgi:hypothetical protein
MKTLILLVALAGSARAQTTASAPIDPKWKLDPRIAAEQEAAARAKRVQGLFPAAGGPWSRSPDQEQDRDRTVAVPAPKADSDSYLNGLVRVSGGKDNKKDVRADLTGIILPDSPSGTLTVGALKHDGPQGMEASTLANSAARDYVKGPKAVVAVTLKIHW